jgi:hypothetical protein
MHLEAKISKSKCSKASNVDETLALEPITNF